MRLVRLDKVMNRVLGRFRNRANDLKIGAKLGKVWPDVVGEVMQRFCHPVGISGKTLTVGITSPVWMAELEYHKVTLLDNLEKALGKRCITSIQLTMLQEAFIPARQQRVGAPSEPTEPLPPEKSDQLERDLERISDPQLREQMRRVLKKSMRPERA